MAGLGFWPRERRALGAVLLACTFLMVLGLDWGLPNLESWAGDDISPEKPLRVIYDASRGFHKYPYLHWWLNAVLYAPWVLGAAAWGQADLSCLPRLEASCFERPVVHMTALMLLTRLLSVAMALGTVLLTHRITARLTRDRAAPVLAAATVGFSVGLTHFAHTGNLDVPATFWFTASLLAAFAVIERGAQVDYLAFGLLAGCTMATKDALLGATFSLALVVLAAHVRRERLRGRSLLATFRSARLWWMALSCLGLYALVQNLPGNPSGFVRHVGVWLEGGESLEALRARDRSTLQLLRGSIASASYLLGPLLALLVGLGAVRAGWSERRALVLLAPLVGYFLVSIVLAGFAAPRLLVPMLPVLAVFAGLGGAWLIARPGAARVCGGAVVTAALVWAFAASLHADLQMLADARYDAERFLAREVPEGVSVAGFGSADFLPRFARAGITARYLDREDLRADALERDPPKFLVLTSLHRPKRLRERLEALRDGRAGYRVRFDRRGTTPLDRFFGERLRVGAVNPRITILERVPGEAAVSRRTRPSDRS